MIERPRFYPVEHFKYWPHNVNWKMVAIGEFIMLVVALIGIIHSSGGFG